MVGIICLSFAVGQAMATKRVNMESALVSLNSAKTSLEKAAADKAGHRVKAINLVKQAITEVKAGIKKATS